MTNFLRPAKLASTLLVLALAPQARATTVLFGDLNPIPETGSTASGFGAIVVDGLSMNLTISFSGLFGDATAAGFYGPTFYPLLIPALSSTSLSLTADFVLTPEQAADILAEVGYFAVSSTAFPEGEISGIITQRAEGNVGNPPEQPSPTLVPEPASLLLSAAGLSVLGVAGCRRWRRSSGVS